MDEVALRIALIHLKKGMHPTILSPAIAGQTGVFNLGMATSQGEEKLWIQTHSHYSSAFPILHFSLVESSSSTSFFVSRERFLHSSSQCRAPSPLHFLFVENSSSTLLLSWEFLLHSIFISHEFLIFSTSRKSRAVFSLHFSGESYSYTPLQVSWELLF